ncbi:MAG: hypothetical protein JSW47_08700 [Phycisphaerales bacterium]|nr:MAG: hypothetical protein JSW47_08700 [Phycisphaerales bacterium]UCF16735.1 MAG: hypothetical protein JSW59_04575 [Phycisphaerales bacterium]
MALIEKNREPTSQQLKVFGLLLGPFLGLIGVLLFWRIGTWTIPVVCWIVALLWAMVYHCVPSIKRTMYVVWMAVMYPIGWLVSHALLVLVYFGWITPVGLLMRLFGYDPMRRRLGREAASNWIRRKPAGNLNRYFRQY